MYLCIEAYHKQIFYFTSSEGNKGINKFILLDCFNSLNIISYIIKREVNNTSI